MTHKLNSDKTAAIAPNVKWLLIDEHTPIGVRMHLIDRAQNIALTRIRRKDDAFTHWFPIATFEYTKK